MASSSVISGKPIPALYVVYVLRSTVRNASLYIGSTPHPPRRLKQHNGDVIGGARRTSNLRPWEMVTIVSGFPSMVAALKFEWALNNPHMSTHIPDQSRISKSTSTKPSGRRKRPVKSLTSCLANVHLLVQVPSFNRWPLKIHIFTQDAYSTWKKIGLETPAKDMVVLVDFGPGVETRPSESVANDQTDAKEVDGTWGIHALTLDYKPMKDYVTKSKDIFDFEREGKCVVCEEKLVPQQGIYAVCPNQGCEGVGHVVCWSNHMLSICPSDSNVADKDNHIIPLEGTCPSCKGDVEWGYMMKELSLRLRGEKEVDQLLRKRSRKTKAEKEREREMKESNEDE